MSNATHSERETDDDAPTPAREFATAYHAVLRAAGDVSAGVAQANDYLLRRFAASKTNATVEVASDELQPLASLDIGFDAPYDSTVLGEALAHVVGDLYGRGDTGSYYTPSEMVEFMVEQTVRPQILDRITDADNPDADLEDWIDSASPTAATAALDSVDSVSVCDPACGSGHFLVGALDELVAIRHRLRERAGEQRPEWRLARRTAEQNIYGVDLHGEAAEMAKLRIRLRVLEKLPAEQARQYAEPSVEYDADREVPA